MMDGTPINVDVTAPGAIIALALIFLKVIFSIRILFVNIIQCFHINVPVVFTLNSNDLTSCGTYFKIFLFIYDFLTTD